MAIPGCWTRWNDWMKMMKMWNIVKFPLPKAAVLPARSMIYSRSIFSGNLSDAKEKHAYIYIVLYRLFHIILYSYINIILYMCMYLDKRGKGWLCVCACSCAYMSTHMDYSTHVRTYISTELCPNMFHVSHRCLQLVHSGCQWINLIDW